MINEALYNKTVNILFDAYFNDTLRHGKCTHCAVGNILRPSSEELNIPVHRWANIFITKENASGGILTQLKAGEGEFIAANYFGEIKIYTCSNATDFEDAKSGRRLIDASGYTVNELARVEYAFENAPQGNSDEDWMYNGLVSVLEVLKQIHQVEDDAPVVSRFANHYQTLTHD